MTNEWCDMPVTDEYANARTIAMMVGRHPSWFSKNKNRNVIRSLQKGRFTLWHIGDSLKCLGTKPAAKIKTRAWDCVKYGDCLGIVAMKNGELNCQKCKKYVKNQNMDRILAYEHAANQMFVAEFCKQWKRDDMEGFTKWIMSKE